MPTTTVRMTVDEFFDYAATRKGRARCELMRGEVREMSPANESHGDIALRLSYHVAHFVFSHGLGKVYAAETGFVLDPNPAEPLVLAPDVAFVHKGRAAQAASRRFCPIPPDFCAEVLSPSDRVGEVNEKIDLWLRHGVRLVWVVDLDRQTITAYTPDGQLKVYRKTDVIDGGDVLPGFELALDKLFIH